jgi:hypothetical protein
MKKLFQTGIAALFLTTGTAHAADTMLTLACKGTAAHGNNNEQLVSLGVIINFTKGTIDGIGAFPIKIIRTDETTVMFREATDRGWGKSVVYGSIDRVTGDLQASEDIVTEKGGREEVSSYELKCKPAQRMF